MPTRKPFFLKTDGIPMNPHSNPTRFRQGLKFRARNGEVLQSTYPKSGTKWGQYITQLILKKGEPIRSYEDWERNTRTVEYMEDEEWQTMLPLRTLYTRLPLSREMINKEAKYIYIARNPWDVALSYFDMVSDISVFNFQDGTFDEFLDAFLDGDVGYGSYFDHVASGYALKDEPNMFFMTYEELKKYTRGTVIRLAYFLGEQYGRDLEDVSNGLLDMILERSTPTHMREIMVVKFEAENETPYQVLARASKLTSKRGNNGDIKKYAIVRNAEVGGWKKSFTSDQLRRVEAKIQQEGEKASFMTLWKDMREEAIRLCHQS